MLLLHLQHRTDEGAATSSGGIYVPPGRSAVVTLRYDVISHLFPIPLFPGTVGKAPFFPRHANLDEHVVDDGLLQSRFSRALRTLQRDKSQQRTQR